jgi:hypothetical protein
MYRLALSKRQNGWTCGYLGQKEGIFGYPAATKH